MTGAAPERLRLFVAADVPAEVRGAVHEAAEGLRSRAPGLRWTDPAGWHLTLVFLGWTDARLVDGVHGAIRRAVAGAGPLSLTLDGTAGCFRGGVLWAGLRPAPALAALVTALRSELVPLGFRLEERPYHAHLTLARAPRRTRVPCDLTAAYAGPVRSWAVEHVLLMRSRPSGAGSRYEPLRAWPLGPGNAGPCPDAGS